MELLGSRTVRLVDNGGPDADVDVVRFRRELFGWDRELAMRFVSGVLVVCEDFTAGEDADGGRKRLRLR